MTRPEGERAAKRARSPAASAALTGLLYALFLALRFQGGWDPSLLAMAGTRYCKPERVPPSLTVQVRPGEEPTSGFDGQFYYRLALDPFTRERSAFGITLDLPAHRQQRLLYPLLAWLFCAGRPETVPTALLGINLAGLVLLGWLGGWWPGKRAATPCGGWSSPSTPVS